MRKLIVVAMLLVLTGCGFNYRDKITCYSNGTQIYEKSGVEVLVLDGRSVVYYPSGKTDHVSGNCVIVTFDPPMEK